MPLFQEVTNTVVCDVGSAWLKTGFAGEDSPTACLPTLVGWQPSPNPGCQASAQSWLVGEACTSRLSELRAAKPIQNGCIQDWEAVEKLWKHSFHDLLHITPAEQRLLLTEGPLTPQSTRQRMFEVVFESLGFCAASTQVQAALTLYAQGLMTGLSVDAGDITYVVPVVDGYAFPHMTKRVEVAGEEVTTHLLDLLLRRGYAFNHTTDMASLRKMKEQICYVACNYQREVQLARETTCVMCSYTLPDGRTIKVGSERFMAPEAMFSPRMVDKECEGLSDVVFSCIQGMDVDNRMPMFQHIVLSGGSTMFGGLSQRLEADIRALYLRHTLKGDNRGLRKLKLRIDDPPYRQNLVFLGASILASIMRNDDGFWIRKADWEEDPFRALRSIQAGHQDD